MFLKQQATIHILGSPLTFKLLHNASNSVNIAWFYEKFTKETKYTWVTILIFHFVQLGKLVKNYFFSRKELIKAYLWMIQLWSHFSKVLEQRTVHCLFWHHPFKMMNFIKIWASRKDHFTLWTPPLATNLCQVDFFFWTYYVPDYFFVLGWSNDENSFLGPWGLPLEK